MVKDLELGTQKKFLCKTCHGETRHELKATQPKYYYDVEAEGTEYERLVFWEK